MSYYSHPANGPGGQDYWYDDYDNSAYHGQGSSRHQLPSRSRPSHQQQYQQYQHQYQQQPDPRMRFPRPQAYTRAQQTRPVEPPHTRYDGADYSEPEDDQWPLSSQAAPAPAPAPAPREQIHPKGPRQPSGARSGPPPRPQRPDELPRQAPRSASANHPYQKSSMQYQQAPRSVSAKQQPTYQQPQYQQSHHGTGQWTGDGYSYDTPPSSSSGHPVAQQASYSRNMPPRPPLGPPPSSRRGPPSYYSQQLSPVHPIVEEVERASLVRDHSREGEAPWASQSHASLTSSNAIPIGIPKFYLDGRESGVSITPSSAYSDYAPDNSPPRHQEPIRAFKQRMQEQRPEDNSMEQPESPTPREINDYFPPVTNKPVSAQRGESPSEGNIPVRQASLGKRSKPTLTTVKGGDRLGKRSSASNEALTGLPSQQRGQIESRNAAGASRMQREQSVAPDASEFDESPVAPLPPVHGTSSNASFLDSSSESAKSPEQNALVDSPKPSIRLVNKSQEQLSTPQPAYQGRGRSPLARTDDDDDNYDAYMKETLGDPEKSESGGLARQDSEALKAPPAGYSGLRAGKRRPPRLDVDQIKEEEARGSLTSLSDLIKRATRLASNLDRGRTASRLGMEHFLGNGNGNNSNPGELGEKYRQSNGSFSGMLASFPPPGDRTASGSLANWSSRRQSRPLPSNSDAGSRTRGKGRRCCGIPLWLFVLLSILLLALVAAAVVIPIVLVVLPNMNDDSSSTSAQGQTTGTQASILSKCATKLTCENGGQAFPNTESDEDTCKCLCVNSYTGPTCSSKSTAGCSSLAVPGMSQNATIGSAIPRLFDLAETDFDLQLNTRAVLGLFNEADLSCAAENALVSFDGKAQKRRRTAAPQASETQAVHPAEATSNGIVYDSTPSPSKSSGSPSPSPSASPSSTPSAKVDVDFARAAVLYILQESSSIEEAESAQKVLQESLDGGKGGIVSVGDWKVDLKEEKVTKQ